jgi:hypothetical protein
MKASEIVMHRYAIVFTSRNGVDQYLRSIGAVSFTAAAAVAAQIADYEGWEVFSLTKAARIG